MLLHKIYDNTTKELINKDCEIIIGNNCWIASGVKILKGVKISDGNIIAANSIITKSIAEQNAIISSDRILKDNIMWES